ncbi:DUF397 domain-containing protein [Actinomadura miaoliensis]|uniref:DUF397 domain-containing protein n=1 Tax=Actinomadura miaoliensis TaxID=430685 RepID=UPI0031EFE4B2
MGLLQSRHNEPNGECVEVGRADDGIVGVRDTKQHGTGPVLEFSRGEWAVFVRKVRKHEIDAWPGTTSPSARASILDEPRTAPWGVEPAGCHWGLVRKARR